MNWYGTKDGDPQAFHLFRRHYTFREGRKIRQFVGPGGKMVLVTPLYDALFVWRKFIDDSGQKGVNCAVFRNESALRSSDLILEAEELAWKRWPGERLYTYINPRKVKSSNPGYCFMMAGWRKCGKTKGGLVILEKKNTGEDSDGRPMASDTPGCPHRRCERFHDAGPGR